MHRLVLYSWLLILVFISAGCQQKVITSTLNAQNNYVDSGQAVADSQIVRFYLPYKEMIEAEMNEVIGDSESEMIKDKPESLLTNFLADLLLEEGSMYCKSSNSDFKPQISYFNYGGIRSFLPKGEITVRNVYELMPFENEMVFLNLKGKDVQAFLDIIAAKGGDSVGGARFIISKNKAKDILVEGEKLDVTRDYWLVTNDYIAGGGDNMDVLLNRLKIVNSGEKIRDLIINHLREMSVDGEKISVKTDGRIINE